MMRIILTWLAAAASVLSCALPFMPGRNEWTAAQGAWLTLGAVLFAIALIADVRDRLRHKPKEYKTQASINAYMHAWISKGGRVVVFTRDHTWAHEPVIETVLFEKARRHELTMCLPVDTDLSRKLRHAGAEIITYPALGLTPSSRFTIINDGQGASAAVAIGRKQNGVHVIEEFPMGDPVFAVASDLVKVLRRVQA